MFAYIKSDIKDIKEEMKNVRDDINNVKNTAENNIQKIETNANDIAELYDQMKEIIASDQAQRQKAERRCNGPEASCGMTTSNGAEASCGSGSNNAFP